VIRLFIGDVCRPRSSGSMLVADLTEDKLSRLIYSILYENKKHAAE